METKVKSKNSKKGDHSTQRSKIFFQKQKDGNNCRMHSINNLLGRAAVSKKKFFSLCDEFDKQNNCGGSREFFFISSEDNLLSFILRQFHCNTEYYAIGEGPRLTDDFLEDCEGFLNFSEGHVWACRKVGNVWMRLDSLESNPSPIKPRRLSNDGGFIILRGKTNKNPSNQLKVLNKEDETILNEEEDEKTVIDVNKDQSGTKELEENVELIEEQSSEDEIVNKSNPFLVLSEVDS
jgi:hypothetical protein